jgi:predicted DNA-binding transcriptional regulator YafY
VVAALDIPFAQAQRLRFIESVVLWEGAIQRQRVSEVFDVSPNHVSRDFLRYREAFPGNLEYDPSGKEYRAASRFQPKIASGKPEEYLALLRAHVESGLELPALGDAIAADVVPSPPVGVDRAVLRAVVRAIRRGEGLTVTYGSVREDRKTTRRLWPHALAYSGFRWHVRAYDATESMFRDFALARLEDPQPVAEASPAGEEGDIDWNTYDTIEVVPHARLSDSQRAIVAREFGMKRTPEGWLWSQRLRKALIPYFLHRYRLDLDPARTAIRIELKDRTQMRAYFFAP